jgi:type IX secretion system PorP/SprF family membrane protein
MMARPGQDTYHLDANTDPMKKLITVFIYSFAYCFSYGQQDPVYSLYLNNPFVINPAYAGLNNLLHTQVAFRTQWAGIDGNPKTLNLSGHTSVYNNKGGVGIQIIQDRIGENKNTEVQVAFSYKVRLPGSTLSFGMHAAMINFTGDPGALTIRHPDDPDFISYSEFSFNTGAGLLLKSERYLLGLSAPRLLPATVDRGRTPINVYNQALYLTGAYIFIVSEKVRFKPTVLLRGMKNNPVSTDIQANFSFNDLYTAGILTRNLETFGLLGSFRYRNLQLGYVFELPTNRSVGSQFSTHEVMLSMRTSMFRFHEEPEVSAF